MSTPDLSLYRRWRPQRFADVVGQPWVVETLRSAVAQGRTSHAYLLSGQRGIGKTTLARILARAVNCVAPEEGEPCNRCESCLRILEGRSLDVIEIDGASNRGIDQIRQLREQVTYLPAGSKRKVYIIDEIHMLTGEAFNALLKTLEEPPGHALFVFATTEAHKVPATVISRCQAFELAPIAEGPIADVLLTIAAQEGLEVEPSAAHLIARRSGGALRDAQVVLEQLANAGRVTERSVVELLGLPRTEEVEQFVSALLDQDASVALGLLDAQIAKGRDIGVFLDEAAVQARDQVIAGTSELIPIARRLIEIRAELPRTVSRRIHVELAVLELCGPPRPCPAGAEPTPEASEDEPQTPAAGTGEGPQSETTADDSSDADPTARPALEGTCAAAPEPWQDMLAACAQERVSIAAFLAPAKVSFVDGVLWIRLPAECQYHYESLQSPAERAYVERSAQAHFGGLLAVHVEWEGAGREALSLDESARLAAEMLEGRVVEKES